MDTYQNFDHTRLDRDNDGQLLFFMIAGPGDEYKESIKLLIENDFGIVFGNDNETVLFERSLLEIRNTNLETPLLASCKNGDACIINLLLIKGSKLDAIDVGGNTCLINVCLNENQSVKDLRIPILKNLIIRGADYEATNENLQNFLSLLLGEEKEEMENFIKTYKKK